MTSVVSLSRYPVKGFTPEPLDSIVVQDDGRVAGDRVLAFRFGNAALPEEKDGLDYWPKARGLSLQDFPSLAALRLEYQQAERVLRFWRDGELLVEGDLEPAGRRRLETAMAEIVLGSPEAARLERPGRLPLALVGDGVTSRFQDRARGFVSVHSEASVATLADALGAAVDHRRFRSNIVITGVEAEAELRWADTVRIGDVAFEPQGSIVRCLATHANPETGVRDLPVLTTLTQQLGQRQPTMGRLLLPTDRGGVIQLGDTVC
ncbi:MOSC domain [Leucobacter sp. 7(1)]|uniref:MOSC domain-containing protein n=1 Tax=Leucobacter sp. 7(1) TaxID=1255613 RepID=UPI00097E7E22|nr:MOSC domain-containing protein [Leucobacter sp. 7(1)]SJN12456.1 MOSC domain [Leucobacter sp. 7(1)]